MTHLWEPEHSYYCAEGNYFCEDAHAIYDSWASFIEEDGGGDDLDLNLVFRWDWRLPTNDACEPLPPNPDPHVRDATLWIFFMCQRKARCWSVEVSVCQADEPAVREWLAARWKHLAALWAPLSGGPPEADGVRRTRRGRAPR